jgi:hypothetical protein
MNNLAATISTIITVRKNTWIQKYKNNAAGTSTTEKNSTEKDSFAIQCNLI